MRKKSFFGATNLEKLIGKTGSIKEIKEKTDVTTEHIFLFKQQCKQVLEQNAKFNTFPLNTLFMNSTQGNKPQVDKFTEAVYFCVDPIKAQDYVEKILKKEVGFVLSNASDHSNPYEIKDPSYDWYTYQPAEGKGFWWGVRKFSVNKNQTKQKTLKKIN